ncbi:MAG: geranylgeranyl reductase family protein [Firmicutes bacterium]|nr:geranylgeranyl reductase family protein [Bacillota bacterium]
MTRAYDCIVVGAGPAGSTAATQLAQDGVRVLVLEQDTLPRYKACAGAVSGRATGLLTLDFSSVVEDVIHKVKVRWANADTAPIEYVSKTPIAYLVMRTSFDQLLVQEAITAGAIIHDGEKVQAIDLQPEHVAVQTTHSTYKAATLIGADGAVGIVARQSGLYLAKSSGIALEIEASVPPDQLAKWKNTVLVSYGIPRHGYGWLFPKSQHLSLGMGTFSPRRREFVSDFSAFTDSLGIPWEWQDLKAHPIPLGGRDRRFCLPRLLLVGDAAGLADPLSGEGIAHALHSGLVAADSVLASLDSGDFSMHSYQTAIEQEINSNLRVAKQLSNAFYTLPKVFFHLFLTSQEILAWYFQLVQGDRDYQDVWELVRKLLKPQGLLKWREHGEYPTQ